MVDRPAARSRSPSSPPAHPSARGRGTNSSKQTEESRRRGSGERWKRWGQWGSFRRYRLYPRHRSVSSSLSYPAPRRRLIISSSAFSQRAPFPLARRYSLSSRSSSCSSFRRLVVLSISFVISSPPSSYPSSSCRIVRRFACSSLVVLPRRSVVVSFYPVGSFVLPVSRHDGRGVFSFDSEAGKQARGRGGAWDSEGRDKQAGEAAAGRYEIAPPIRRDGAGRGAYRFFLMRWGEGVLFPPSPVCFSYRAS